MASILLAEQQIRIPTGFPDLEAFRRWARSDAYPESGRFSYLRDELYVDLSMEELFGHNLVKGEFAIVLGGLVKLADSGYFFHDRTRLSDPAVGLSTEPDGTFVAYETVRAGRVRLMAGATGGYVELEGGPDMTLEVVSPTSQHKDLEELPDLYWRAGVTEYWLVDTRGDALRFDIFRHGSKGYTATRRQPGGWLKSQVFGRSFQLARTADALGHVRFVLNVRP